MSSNLYDPEAKAGSVHEIEIKGTNDVNNVLSDSEDRKGHSDRTSLEKKFLRKLDIRMSVLVLIYILNYIDRTNTSSARLQGFEQDLHLQGQQFSTIMSILFVGYIIMQVPSNMFLNWMGRPSIYLPACMSIWGVISILTGVTENFVGALLTRFFIGFVEAAFFPGALFLISRWYKRDEVGLRTSILYCGSLISNGFGALIASGILADMQGKLGHAAWRWLFYIEGSITIFVAICAMFILPDFPENTRWLTPEERQLAITRLQEDVAKSSLDIDLNVYVSPLQGLWMGLTDWRMWWFAAAAVFQLLAQSFYIFFPTLSATMGYGTTISLLLCAPPWVFSALLAFVVSRYSDKTKQRFIFIAVSEVFGIVGFIISICTMHIAARYISLFLMAQTYAGLIVFYAWMSNTFPWPPAKRAVCLGFMNGFSQIGNISGSYIWPSTWGPTYRYSYAICIVAAVVFAVMCYVMSAHLISLNKKIEKEEEDNGVLTPGFRYLV
ncbi:hypothetical protein SERLA73DRAFT_77799 [Serpula lacrymans var. lacrymans S7.3]|uniref:Major facilitator superfamily (MFS) profile domain-containing protein n=1 Tax=Serpula lacrymans var. lacrymans (strain S7.3) TaxID=936435 RepID=F8QB11_SERL3|nr:hypothetical protein SERLA73DRAFT_77799 [Serpula lacrymans var. lacrymans S7.3]